MRTLLPVIFREKSLFGFGKTTNQTTGKQACGKGDETPLATPQRTIIKHTEGLQETLADQSTAGSFLSRTSHLFTQLHVDLDNRGGMLQAAFLSQDWQRRENNLKKMLWIVFFVVAFQGFQTFLSAGDLRCAANHRFLYAAYHPIKILPNGIIRVK